MSVSARTAHVVRAKITLTLAICAAVLSLPGCASMPSDPVAVSAATTSPPAEPAATSADAGGSTPADGELPAASAQLTTRISDGTLFVRDDEAAFEVQLPRGYQRITSAAQLQKIAAAVSKVLGSSADSSQVMSEHTRLLAMNPLSGMAIQVSTFPANGMTGSDLLDRTDEFGAQIKQLYSAQDVSTYETTLASRRAIRLVATAHVGDRTAQVEVYITISGDTLYTLSFSGLRIDHADVEVFTSTLHFS